MGNQFSCKNYATIMHMAKTTYKKVFSSPVKSIGIGIGSIVLIVVLVIGMRAYFANMAATVEKPIAQQIEKLGGVKVCENGSAGKFLDNTDPWYMAYYTVPNSPALTQNIKNIASEQGFQLSNDDLIIAKLKQSGAESSQPAGVPLDAEVSFNPNSDYLNAAVGTKNLSIIVHRQAIVTLDCGNDSGKQITLGPNEAIVEVSVRAY